jgi:ABC-type tungstate transport system substrate-binding protein
MEKIPFQGQVTNLGSEIRNNVTLISKIKPLTAFFTVMNYKDLYIFLSRPNGPVGNHNCLKYVFDDTGKVSTIEHVQLIHSLAIVPVFININMSWVEANPEEVGQFCQ